MSNLNQSEAEHWNRYWRDGYGARVVKVAEKVCSKRACNTILNYLYENDYPNSVQIGMELTELRSQITALIHTLNKGEKV